MSQKKSFKFPKFKGLKNTKKPNKTSPAAARKILRGPLFWIIAALIAVSIFGQISATGEEFKKVETSVILNEISLNNVKSALVIDREQKVQVVLKDGEFVDGAAKIEASYVAGQEALIVELLTSNPPSTTWDIKVPKQSLFVSLILSILPILLIIFLLLLFMGGGQGSRVLSFGRSRAKLQNKEMPTNTFVDVAGADEAVAELREIKDFLASPEKYKAIGAKIPKGVLLYGPPGTGKTTLAQLIARAGSAKFMELFAINAGVKDVREVITAAKENKSLYGVATVLFVDEVHRFNKTQQDALLPGVENGWVTLVAATTENPSFSVIAPLMSRSLLVTLSELNEHEITNVVVRAISEPRGLNDAVSLEPEALEMLIRLAGGDARRARARRRDSSARPVRG